MQIKTTMRYYFTPVRLAKRQEITSVGKDVKKRTHTLFTGMWIGTASVEKSVEDLQKIRNIVQVTVV